MLGSGGDLAARHRFTYRLDPLRRPFVATAVEHGAAILRSERVNRADDADADCGPRTWEGVEPVVEVQCLRLLAGIDANGVVGAQQVVGREQTVEDYK